MKKPRVSVLTPVYNGQERLPNMMAAIRQQTFEDFEWIICDDGSTDHTSQILDAANDHRIRRLYHPQRKGIPFARNALLKEAKTDLLAWCDADDIPHPQRLQAQYDFLSQHPSFIAVFTTAVFQDGPLRRYIDYPSDDQWWLPLLFFKQPLVFSSCMNRAINHLWFDETLLRTQDHDYLWNLSQRGQMSVLKEIETKYLVDSHRNRVDAENHRDYCVQQLAQRAQHMGIASGTSTVEYVVRLLRDIKSLNDIQAKQALQWIAQVEQHAASLFPSDRKPYIRAIYTYLCIKAAIRVSPFLITEVKWARPSNIMDLVRLRF
jgi:glycosyltransferase involved in cell wall biosynthesis